MFLGYFLAVITIFFWGITFISTKILLIDFSPIEILFFRFIAAYAGLWIFHPKTMKIPFKDNLIFLLAGLTGVTLYQFTENVALSYTSASNVSLIVSMCPLFTAIITQIFLKEKAVTRWFVLGFVVDHKSRKNQDVILHKCASKFLTIFVQNAGGPGRFIPLG